MFQLYIHYLPSRQRDAALIQIHHPPHRLTYTENYTGDTEYTAGTLCRLKCKIKYQYQGTQFKIKFRPLAELDPTRPVLSCKFSDPTRSDPTRPAGRVGSRVVQLWSAVGYVSVNEHMKLVADLIAPFYVSSLIAR